MSDDLVLLADSTSLHVVCDPFLHSWPLILFLSLAECFVLSWVTGRWMVVHEIHDSLLDYVNMKPALGDRHYSYDTAFVSRKNQL